MSTHTEQPVRIKTANADAMILTSEVCAVAQTQQPGMVAVFVRGGGMVGVGGTVETVCRAIGWTTEDATPEGPRVLTLAS